MGRKAREQMSAAEARERLGFNDLKQPTAHGVDRVDQMTTEELWAQVDDTQQEITAAELRMLKQLHESEQVGAATLEQLHGQGEQLDRIKREQENISDNLTTSGKIMKSLSSFRVMILQMVGLGNEKFSQAKFAGKRQTSEERSQFLDEPSNKKRSTGRDANPRSGSGGGDNMDHISQSLTRLREQADEMNAELKIQSKKIDGLTVTTDKHSDQLMDNNKKARKFLGRKRYDAAQENSIKMPTSNPAAHLFPTF